MGLYLVIPLIEVIFCLGMLVLLFAAGRQHKARKPFALFLFFITLWGLFIFLMRLTPESEQALIWEKLILAAMLSTSFSFYRFTLLFTGVKLSKPVAVILVVCYVSIMCLIPANLIVSDMQSLWWGKGPVAGPLFPFYLMGVYIPMILAALSVYKQLILSTSQDEKSRDQYIIAGVIIMILGGITDYLPAVGINIYPLGSLGAIVFGILATIAMLRHDLLEIKVVLRKGAAYSLVSILVLGIFGCVILLLTQLFGTFISPFPLIITIFAIFIIAAVFQPLTIKLQHVVDRWFLRQRYDALQALKKFSKDTEGIELNQLCAILVTTVANGMQSAGVYLLLPSVTTGDFITWAYSGSNHQEKITFAATGPLAITMKYQNRIMDCDELDTIPPLSSLASGDRKVLIDRRISLLVPLRCNDRLTGMLLLENKTNKEPYLNEERQLLQSISESLAARIEGARRLESIKIEQQALHKTIEGVIYALSAVVASRDPYTAGHQRRVAELARAIAGEMALSEWHKYGMYIIGLLHDVGKIAVPAEILSKPGKINHHEFDIIKNHSQVGYEILEKIEFPWPVSKAIKQHHERLNGSGYPEGLSGSDIILEARILGVADVVEAMSSHRPYRPALGLEKALKEITDQSGTLYDGEVVEACLRLLKNKEMVFEKLMSAADQETAGTGGYT